MFALVFHTDIFIHDITILMLHSTLRIQRKIAGQAAVDSMCLKSKHLMLKKKLFLFFWLFSLKMLKTFLASAKLQQAWSIVSPTNSGASLPYVEQRIRIKIRVTIANFTVKPTKKRKGKAGTELLRELFCWNRLERYCFGCCCFSTNFSVQTNGGKAGLTYSCCLQ